MIGEMEICIILLIENQHFVKQEILCDGETDVILTKRESLNTGYRVWDDATSREGK